MTSKFKCTGVERTLLLRELRRVYKSGDQREFMRILRKYGIKDENPRFAEIVKFFHDLRSAKT
jgi:hypothetical protein